MLPGPPRAIAAQAAVVLVAAFLVVWAWRADLTWFERHVYPGYCAVSHGQTVWPTAARIAALVVAALLLLLIRPRLARWAARARAFDLAAVGVAVAAALLVSDLFLRRRPAVERTPLERDDMPRAVTDGRVGWRFRPSQTVTVTAGGGPVEYAVDAAGNRARSAGEPIDPDRPTIVIAGESIAFGESLAWDDTFAAHLAADLDVQIVNTGVPAYGSEQAYRRAEEALAGLRRPVALVTVFIPQVIRRNGREEGLGLARLWRDEPYHGDGALDLTRERVAATARLARQRGAAPLFVVTNFGPACGDDAWLFPEIFA
ncbi:MAG TPA: hypothetical protein VIG06_00325, partial [Kofleriaceae bacterium]